MSIKIRVIKLGAGSVTFVVVKVIHSGIDGFAG